MRPCSQAASYTQPKRRFCKRCLDVIAALIGLAMTSWIVAIAAIAARIDTGASGIFFQQRLGRDGRLFWVCKIRTMRTDPNRQSTVTTANDPRITPLGRQLRRWKVDELPQLWNVLVGDMSLVGPRPDMPKYLPLYRQYAPEVLAVRPGITGPATLCYRDEEKLLALADDSEALNDAVLLPHKLRLNAEYARNYTVRGDIALLLHTLAGTGPRLTRLEDLPLPVPAFLLEIDEPARTAA